MATVLLIVGLVAYSLCGAVLGFNLWSASDRLAEQLRNERWYWRQLGGDNPDVWRGGGIVMLAFGLITVLWIFAQWRWALPVMDPTAGAWT
jgi:hypothetical protein